MESVHLGSFCASQNVTYAHRVYDPDANNWCPVPGGGADALLFAGLAVFISCALYSKLSAVWVLLAGALFQLLSTAYNLNHFSNALTIWLGMHPSTIFFEIFLPPLLLDSAVRLDFFLFRKVAVHTLIFAFVNVVVSTLAFIPLMLYVLNLTAAGWRAVDAALFGAMLGSTDAVAVTAILKAGGAPEMLSVLLECESLFNDASSIVLFEIFLHMSSNTAAAGQSVGNLSHMLWSTSKQICWLSLTGALAGLVMGLLTRLFFKLLHKRHVPPPVEVAVSLAGAYTVYLCTEYYIQGSGVIAVVVYGLYGASSYLYGFSSKGLRQGAFFKFWDVVSFTINGMVFFFVGCSTMHFFLSLSGPIFKTGSAEPLLLTLRTLPGIIIAMFGLRWALITLEAPLLSLTGHSLSWQEVLFSTFSGLRGGLALILAQTVIANHGKVTDPQLKVVHAEMVIWTSAVVLFTLTVNAPLLGPLMTLLGLNKATPAQKHMHRRAHAALSRFTSHTIIDLQADDDEMLKGVDWTAVISGATLCSEAAKDLLERKDLAKNSAKPQDDDDDDPESQEVSRTSTYIPQHKKPMAAVTPGSPQHQHQQGRLLRRANSSHRSGNFKGITVPLLGRQYSGRGADRYAAVAGDGADSESEDGDLEAGTGRQVIPPVVAESSSEAVFIASRLRAQEQQLAQHAQQGTAPFLADDDAILPHAVAAGSPDESSDGSSGLRNLVLEEEEDGDEGDVDWVPTAADDDQDQDCQPQQDVAAAAAAAEAGKAKVKFKLLQPVIVFHIAGRKAPSGRTSKDSFTYSSRPETAQLPPPPPPAAAAAPPGSRSRSIITPFTNPTRSFIAAAITAMTGGASSTGNSSPSDANNISRSSSRVLARRSSSSLREQWGARNGSEGLDHPGAAAAARRAPALQRRNSITLMTVTQLLQQQQQQQQQHQQRISVVSSMPGQQYSVAAASRLAMSSSGGGAAAGGGNGGGFAAGAAVGLPREFDNLSEASSEDDSMTQEEFLEECRVSLLAGLKRHFRFKSCEGLLSKTSLRVLDYACDACLLNPGKPLNIWFTIRHDIKHRGLVKYLGALHLRIRKWQTSLLRATARGTAADQLLRWLLYSPMLKVNILLKRRLGSVALTVLEVALELWLALTASPQARMLRHSHTMTSGILQEELKAQACVVWQFITDRQVEAPDEFASLQTHRVQLAVARRQLAFVEQLEQVGAVEEAAAEALQELVERRLHRLESRGPSWSAPTMADIIRRQPFLTDQGDSMLLWLRAYAELRTYTPGQCIVPRKRSGPPGIFIVVSGLVKAELLLSSTAVTYYVGVGGSIGFVSSVLGQDAKQVSLGSAYAQGDALGRGPFVLHLPMRLIQTIRQRAEPALQNASSTTAAANSGAGTTEMGQESSLTFPHTAGVVSPAAAAAGGGGGPSSLNAAAFAQLLLDMHRQAGIMILDRVGDFLVKELADHVEAGVQAIFEYVTHLPPAKAHAKLHRLLEAALGSSSSSSNNAVTDFAADFGMGNAAGSDYGSSFNGDHLQTDGDAAVQLLMGRAAAAAANLRAALRAADLITLAPGHRYKQCSSMLLLKGSIRQYCSSSSSSNAAGTSTATVSADAKSAVLKQYQAPTLLAWGPELFGALEDRYELSGEVYAAGSRGALLLVSTRRDDSSTGSEHHTENDELTVDVDAPQTAQSSADGNQGRGRHSGQQQQQQQQEQQYRCLSSAIPLHKTSAPGNQQDQDAV